MKTKKLFNKIVIAILGMMLLIGSGIAVNKVVKNSPNTKAMDQQLESIQLFKMVMMLLQILIL